MTTESTDISAEIPNQRYKVLKKIDSGGMAEIYLARATLVGGIEKIVAIKRVLPNLIKNKRFVNMFMDEARLCMCLTHANVVQVFDIGFADETYFIVMEFVDGTTLKRIFQRISETGHKMPVQVAAYIAIEVCKGLLHAHQKTDDNGELLGIVHRDVSPPNVLVSKEGEIKLTDFGLAKAKTQLELTDPGVVKGKFSYLSPEAASGNAVDHRADLFALGILLWEILAQRRLFLGKSNLATVELIRECHIPPLSGINSDVTPELEAIVNKALSKEPKDRYHSAQEMCDAISEYLFSNNLKVTSYDVAEFCRAIEHDDPPESRKDRMSSLVHEEIKNLQAIGTIEERFVSRHQKPINDALFTATGGDNLFTVKDLWTYPEGPDVPKEGYLADMLEDYENTRNGALELNEKPRKGKGLGRVIAAVMVGMSLLGALVWWALTKLT